jgi:hypothetical protein
MFDSALPAGLKRFAEREFAGEKLIWAAQPDRRLQALMSFGVWFFAIPWTAFSLFWISIPVAALYEFYSGTNIGAPKGTPIGIMWVSALFGVPFVGIGAGMMLMPLATLRKGWRTLYVLTSHRIAVLEGGRIISITSIRPDDISGLSRTEKPDGRGVLIIDQGFEKDSDGDRIRKKTELGLIENVRQVEKLVAEMRSRQR